MAGYNTGIDVTRRSPAFQVARKARRPVPNTGGYGSSLSSKLQHYETKKTKFFFWSKSQSSAMNSDSTSMASPRLSTRRFGVRKPAQV
jgi:hypothetical protein